MKKVMYCRRTFTALISITALIGLAAYNGFDPSPSVAAIAIGLASANAAEKAYKGGRFKTGD